MENTFSTDISIADRLVADTINRLMKNEDMSLSTSDIPGFREDSCPENPHVESGDPIGKKQATNMYPGKNIEKETANKFSRNSKGWSRTPKTSENITIDKQKFRSPHPFESYLILMFLFTEKKNWGWVSICLNL